MKLYLLGLLTIPVIQKLSQLWLYVFVMILSMQTTKPSLQHFKYIGLASLCIVFTIMIIRIFGQPYSYAALVIMLGSIANGFRLFMRGYKVYFGENNG